LTGIAQAAKLGTLTDEQKSSLQTLGGEKSGNDGNDQLGQIVVPKQKSPFCPWWTCCY
jgi:hypothetical protein